MFTDLERPLGLKWGTSSTTNEDGTINEEAIGGYADQIVEAKTVFKNVFVVASGSVAVGETVWREIYADRPLPNKQTLAMLGTAPAHMVWQKKLAERGLPAGQLLATHHQIDDRSRTAVLDATIKDAFTNDVVPVGNENDAMSLEEMAKLSYGGENDGLASHMAVRFNAFALIINSDTQGLMKRGNLSQLIERIDFDDRSATYAKIQAGWEPGQDETYENNALSKTDACLNAAMNGVKAYWTKAGTPFEEVLANKPGSGTYFEESAWTR